MESKQSLEDKLARFMENCPENIVGADTALEPFAAGLRIYDPPLLGVGVAEDSLFEGFKAEGIIGPHYRTPSEWLPGAKTVLSFFLPYTEHVRKSNREKGWPSVEWLHGRIQGQAVVNRMMEYLRGLLQAGGHACIAPSLEAAFSQRKEPSALSPGKTYGNSSNWSERHAAYVCGLGTFGLTRALITSKGMAGRLGSVVTGLVLPPDPRPYGSPFQYCTMCGRCAARCPVGAISLENGKDNERCSLFLDEVGEGRDPYYGCGKCQVAIPCEGGPPRAALRKTGG